MKSSHCSSYSSYLKAALLFVQLALCFGGPTVAQAGGKDPLAPGPVRPGNLNYRTDLPQGYLKVYSATDEFKDGDVRYFPHSSYAIYTTGGKLFKNVKNQRSADDEVPRGRGVACWNLRRCSSVAARRIRRDARCYQGRSTDDPRLGSLGDENAKELGTQLTDCDL
jgi:hypothetical protein